MRTKTRRVLAQLTLLPLIPAGMFSVVWISNHIMEIGRGFVPTGEVKTWYEIVLLALSGMLIGAVVVAAMLWLWGRFLVAVGLLTSKELWNREADHEGDLTQKRHHGNRRT
jgi:hypothetical protein